MCQKYAFLTQLFGPVHRGGARLAAGLITPVELRDQLTHIRDKKVLVVKVVDATDFHGWGRCQAELSFDPST